MITPIGSGASNEEIINGINNVIREINNNELTKIVKDETGTRRVLMGKGADGFYGMKVSKDGNDVYTAADDELVFNSENNVFKIVQSGTVTVSKGASSSTASTTIQHDLGYAPAILAFANINGYTILPRLEVSLSYGLIFELTYCDVDTTSATFYINAPNTAPTVTNPNYTDAYSISFKYYLLQETAN